MRANWFIGWPVEAPLLDRATGAPPSVRLFARADLHVTLAFLGGCGEERARAAFAGVDEAAATPAHVSFGRVELFGHPRRGTALSATLAEGREALARRIAAARDGLLELAGARPDRRPPRPHVTLGRIRRRAARDERDEALAWAASIDLSGLRTEVDRLALYTWSEERPATQFRIVDAISAR